LSGARGRSGGERGPCALYTPRTRRGGTPDVTGCRGISRSEHLLVQLATGQQHNWRSQGAGEEASGGAGGGSWMGHPLDYSPPPRQGAPPPLCRAPQTQPYLSLRFLLPHPGSATRGSWPNRRRRAAGWVWWRARRLCIAVCCQWEAPPPTSGSYSSISTKSACMWCMICSHRAVSPVSEHFGGP
jgi:hypothetical protein